MNLRHVHPALRTFVVLFGIGLVVVGLTVPETLVSGPTSSATDVPGVEGLFALLVALSFVLWGTLVAAVGATIPGETSVPGVPDLGFSADARRLVVGGALLSGVGSTALAAVGFAAGGTAGGVCMTLAPAAVLGGLAVVGLGFERR